MPELADDAEKVLVKHDNIFQRSGYLARTATTRAETVQGIKRPAGNTIIVPIELDYLLDRLNRLIGFTKYSERKGDDVPCNAPRALASTLLSRSGLWNFKPLVSVITAPTLRPDGSILSAPGYDLSLIHISTLDKRLNSSSKRFNAAFPVFAPSLVSKRSPDLTSQRL